MNLRQTIVSTSFLIVTLSSYAQAAKPCVEGFCVGDTVLVNHKTVAKIQSVDLDTSTIHCLTKQWRAENGDWTSQDTAFSSCSDELVPMIPSGGDFDIGTRVLADGETGAVLGTFADGNILHSDDHFPGLVVSKSDKVYPKITVTARGLKPGMRILDSSDNVGVVLEVFRGEQVSYLPENDSVSQIARDPFYREVEIPSDYAKYTEKARKSGEIGTPVHLFENGKTQFDYDGVLKIVDTLYPEVDELAGIKKGDQVIDLDLTVFTIDQIFSNQTVLLRTQNGYTFLTNLNAESDLERVVDCWAMDHRYNSSVRYDSTHTMIPLLLYPKMRQKIIEYIKDFDKRNRKNVLSAYPALKNLEKRLKEVNPN